jgi:hypothetical protein
MEDEFTKYENSSKIYGSLSHVELYKPIVANTVVKNETVECNKDNEQQILIMYLTLFLFCMIIFLLIKTIEQNY